MYTGDNQQLTAYFKDHATAQDAAADLEAEGISSSDIELHNEHSGGGGFLDGIKRFFAGEPADPYGQGTLLTVTGSRQIVEPILRRYDARIGSEPSYVDSTRGNTSTVVGTDDERTMKLREERLSVDKQAVQAGEVRLGKEVVTERQSIDVPVAHEEVFVSRRPVRDGEYSDGGDIGDDSEISVPVMREEVSVDKHAVVTEEVGLAKQTVQETKTIDGTVRKERATLDGDIAGQVDNARR